MVVTVFLPPSPSGPGMIKSPPLDIANLISILKQEISEKINLLDLRIDIINNGSFWNEKNVNFALFNKFKRCISHLSKEDEEISNNISKILNEINLEKTDYLIFSIAVLEQFSLQYLISSLCLAQRIKDERKNIKIIFFGNCPEEHSKNIIHNFKFIDAFLSDGNEYSIADYVKNNFKGVSIPGIIYRKENELIFTDEKRKLDLNFFPIPDFSMFDLEKYKSNNKLVLPYELSRGCINNCFFCYYIHKNKKIVFKDLKKVIEELKFLIKTYNPDFFHFMDAEINFDNNYLKELCDVFAKELPDIKWSALAVPNIGYDMLNKLKKAGCIQLRWGVEYGSERMLKIINKKTKPDEIKETLKNSYELGIYNYITLISGLDIEKESDIEETIEFIKEIKPYVDSAKECKYGELGHFSLLRWENLFNEENDKFKPKNERYAEILKKCKIPSEDIIEVMIKKPKISFIINPFTDVVAENIPSSDILSSISQIDDGRINYYDFQSLLDKNKKIKKYMKKIKKRDVVFFRRFINVFFKLIKESDYFLFYIPWWNENLRLSLIQAKLLKNKFSKSKILFFGPSCKLYFRELLNKYMFIDGILVGELEETLKEMNQNKNFFEISNIAYKLGGIHINKIKNISFEKINQIDYSKYFMFLKKYALEKPPFIYYELSRGCINNCFFCSRLTSKELRYKKSEFVFLEIQEIMQKFNIKNFYFLDDAINFNMDYLIKFLDEMIRLDLGIKWSAYAIPKNIDVELLKKLRNAGCVHIRWGVESANPKMQKRISKNLDVNEVSVILKQSHEVGISNQISFITGFPHECILDFDLIIKFIKENRDVVDYINIYKFKPRRDTLIFENPEKFGIKIINDKGIKDEVPFDEFKGLNWEMKTIQQDFLHKKLTEFINGIGILDIDPRLAFLKLINHIPLKDKK
ncbi:MAG: radical SAM protein [Nanoarchaeota archaeon]|nr:radical SAM protein [Nanoarchaeota archaeon]